MTETITSPGRRERKKLATRQSLADAAWELCTTQGLDCTTVEQISDAADVSSRTFFNHFSCKEEAVVAALAADEAELLANFRDRPADEHPLDSVITAMSVRLTPDLATRWGVLTELTRTSPQLLAHLLAAVARNEQTLVGAVAERTGTDDAVDHYPWLVCRTANAAVRSALDRWSAGGCTGSIEQVLAAVRQDLAADLRRPAV